MDLFEHLPEKIFRPLSGRSARFNAALLLHLYEHTFAITGETPPRHVVLADVQDFMERYQGFSPEDLEEIEIDEASRRAYAREARGKDIRHYYSFHYLISTGWLIELRDRYRKLIDLSPEGRLLLNEFRKIARGDLRSYGGEVLKVLTLLEAAIGDPENRSAGVHTAWSFAQDFSHHLRNMAATMRHLEEKILSQRELRSVFRSFFDDFVSQYLVEDFKTLYTSNNPFRFRYQVIEKAHLIMNDSLRMARLADGYVSEGRAPDRVRAEEMIRRELDEVYKVFESIQSQLDIIQETQSRIEGRIHTIIRYMDRLEGGSVERVRKAMRALAEAPVEMTDDVPIEPHILLWTPLLGGDIIAAPQVPRPPIERARYRPPPKDPAQEAYLAAKDEYFKRLGVPLPRFREFLERHLEGRESIRGSEITVETVDDFIVFQRLRETPYMFDGKLSDRYGVRQLHETIENEWLTFTDFEVYRKKGRGVAA